MCSLTEAERNLSTSICNLANWNLEGSETHNASRLWKQKFSANIVQHTLSVVIWIAVRVYEKNEIIIERIQNHWNFAAVLNGSQQIWCNVWAKRVLQRKFANQRPFKTASINFWSRSFILLFRFSHIHNERLPFKLQFIPS